MDTFLLSDSFDWVPFWTGALVLSRIVGLLGSLSGIGTTQVPKMIRLSISLLIAIVIPLTGVRAPMPEHMMEGGLMLVSEYLLGWIVGGIPAHVIGALALSGQVTSSSMGLGMANMVDPSLGQNVSVLSRIESLVATIVFLAIDGHHIFFRALAGADARLPLGGFRPGMATAMGLLELFQYTFELAIIITAPILVTILLTQFVLGLMTKSVPQVNIFIISLPLTIGLGLFVTMFTLPVMLDKLIEAYTLFEEWISKIVEIGPGF